LNYALIENGSVTNIIWLHPGDADSFPGAVSLGDRMVEIGDTYKEGAFYRGGERILTPAERAAAEAEDMRAALALLGVDTDAL